MNEIYIRLKALRADHGMHQKVLGEIIGVTQSVISRMEKAHTPLDEVQYGRLVEKFGEAEVSKYVGESKYFLEKNEAEIPADLPRELDLKTMCVLQAQTIKILTETNQMQQKTIETQAQVIATLKERLKG